MRTILVVDDDERLRALLEEYLAGRGFRVRSAPDGEAAIAELRREPADLVVLDLMLPGRDGLEVCREVRTFSRVPIVMLTARGDEMDRIIGLEVGADDYLPKPFNPRELVARIQAVLRRTEAPEPEAPRVARAGPIEVDPDRREGRIHGAVMDLTTTEFDILRTLVENAGRVIPREQIMSRARGEDFAAFERSVDVHVSHLRRKLGDDPKAPRLIKTIRGVGYTIPRDPG